MARYIRASAPPNGDGLSWATAYQNLPSNLTRGETYWIAGGSYGSYTFDDSGSSWIYIKKATVANHGSNDDWLDSYAGQAVFSKWTFSQGYYDIDGQEGGGPSQWRAGHGFKVQRAPDGTTGRIVEFTASSAANVIIAHADLSFSGGTATTSGGADIVYCVNGGNNLVFRYCWVHHAPRVLFYWQNRFNILVEYCCLEYNGRTPSGNDPGEVHSELYVFRGYPLASGLTVRYCYVLDWASTGGFMHGGVKASTPSNPLPSRSQVAENIYIYGNVFERSRTSGDGVIGGWGHSTFLIRNARVYNNTIVNVPSQYKGGGNLFYEGNLENVICRNNLWFNCPTPIINGTTPTSNNWINPPSSPFVDHAVGDYRLAAASPTGYSLGAPYGYDMNGVQRGAAGNWDIGAFEYPQTGGDVVRPVIINGGRSPALGATNVPTNSVITTTFSEAMDATTINTTNLTLSDGGGPVAGTVSYNSGTFTATFTPSSVLSNSTLYTFTVGTGVKDLAGNNMAAQDQWTFTTAAAQDTVQPTIITSSRLPSSGATSVALNTVISVSFSEALNPSTINSTTCKLMQGSTVIPVTVTYNDTTFAVTLSPNDPLSYNTVYTPTFTTGIKDVAGNALASEQTWDFTTIQQQVLGDNQHQIDDGHPDGQWNWMDSEMLLVGWGKLNIGPQEITPPIGIYATLIGQDGSVYRIKELKTGLWMIVI